MKSKVLAVFLLLIVLMTTTVFAEGEEILLTAADATEEVATTGEETETTGEATNVEDEIINSEKFYYGDNIELKDLVDGNVYATGKKVTITGEIGGDLVVVADEVNISGGVAYGSTLIVTKKLVIESGEVRGNLYVVASEVSINGRVYDLFAVTDKFTLEYDGYVYRDLRAMSTETTINGIVGRDAYIETDKLLLDKDCLIPGSLAYKALQEATYKNEEGSESTEIPEGVVTGETTFTKVKDKVLKKEISKVVENLINEYKVTKASSDSDVKGTILAFIFNSFGIESRSEAVKNYSKNGVTIPTAVFIGEIVVIIALVLALILPKTMKKCEKTEKAEEPKKEEAKKEPENKEDKEDKE